MAIEISLALPMSVDVRTVNEIEDRSTNGTKKKGE